MMQTDASSLSLENVSISYGAAKVVDDISFTVRSGEIACLLGPSGCGKTTTLRAIAGFEPIVDGKIILGTEVVADTGFQKPAHRRAVGMVFQDYALFPHLNVAQNISFGLGALGKADRGRRTGELLELIGLGAYAKSYPHELSGGQQQRVAVARALAPRPRLLLLDEPFSNLDVELRVSLGQDVQDLLKREHMTAIMVTHDQNEAFSLCDVVGVMKDGKIEQWGASSTLYHSPANRFVAGFVGEGTFLPGLVQSNGDIETEIGIVPMGEREMYPSDENVDVLFRPGDIVLDPASPVRAVVISRMFRGSEFLYGLRLASGAHLLVLAPDVGNLAPGMEIGVSLKPARQIVLRR